MINDRRKMRVIKEGRKGTLIGGKEGREGTKRIRVK